MSLIKTIKAQLGLSVTPANNFTLDASADNGTMKLARESGQDIMTVDAAGVVSFPGNAQAWQAFSMPSQRALSTQYTNNTPQTIDVAYVGENAGASGYFTIELIVGGVILQGVTLDVAVAGTRGSVYGRVPPGVTYQVNHTGNAGPSPVSWRELR